MSDHTRTLRFDNPIDPTRPLKLSASAGGLEIRMGDMGITDAVATLDRSQTAHLAAWLLEVTQ